MAIGLSIDETYGCIRGLWVCIWGICTQHHIVLLIDIRIRRFHNQTMSWFKMHKYANSSQRGSITSFSTDSDRIYHGKVNDTSSFALLLRSYFSCVRNNAFVRCNDLPTRYLIINWSILFVECNMPNLKEHTPLICCLTGWITCERCRLFDVRHFTFNKWKSIN